MRKYETMHKILEILIEEDHQNSDNAPEYGSLYLFLIAQKLDTEYLHLYPLCVYMAELGDIAMSENLVDGDLCRITRKGKNAFYQKTYLNKVWYRNKQFMNALANWTVTIIGLIFGIYGTFK